MEANKILERIDLKLIKRYVEKEDKEVLKKAYELGRLDSYNLYSFKNKLLDILKVENMNPCEIISIHIDDLNLILCDIIENKH